MNAHRNRSSIVSHGIRLAIAALLALSSTPAIAAAGVAGFRYVSPLPGSRSVTRWNTVAIRTGRPFDARSIDAGAITVTGAKSGVHAGECRLSDDRRTLLFVPREPYAFGETVAVTLGPAVRSRGGDPLPPLAFEFGVATTDPRLVPSSALPTAAPAPLTREARRLQSTPAPVLGAGDMPTNYPSLITLAYDNPDPGCLMLTPSSTADYACLQIVDNLGNPIFFRRGAAHCVDLRKQPNGRLTYFDLGKAKSYALDSLYAVVDSFAAGNGYLADSHDLQLLPNGHALLLIYETLPVGMDTVVVGGDPNALVMGAVIQELDASKNVVFQWRSFDHIAITDAVGLDMTASFIDAVHANAVELDADGNLLLSSRHLSEITKIDRNTGAILWRWGRNAVHNDFTFVDDLRGFSYQHDIRRAPDGHVTLFDNGNTLNPAYSRALEYELDEPNRVARLVHSFLPTGGGLSHSSGSVLKRANGSLLVGWGAGDLGCDVTDYHANGTKALEFTYYTQTITTYRAQRADWKGVLIDTDTDLMDFGSIVRDSSLMKKLRITNNSPATMIITSILNTNTAAFSVLAATPIVLARGGYTDVWIQFKPRQYGTAGGIVYVKSVSANQLVAHPVNVTGVGIYLPSAVPAVSPGMMALLALLLGVAGAAAAGVTFARRA